MPEHQPYKYEGNGLLQQLVRHGHLIPSGELGVYGRGSVCDAVCSRVNNLITQFTLEDEPEKLRFPPLVPRRLLDDVGYTRNFPHLCGAIMSINADEALRSEPKLEGEGSLVLEHTGLALLPAACYPAYPAIARRGVLTNDGASLDLGATCVYRNEPSYDPVRLQVFHQRELVRIGDAAQVLAWRERWLERATTIYSQLQLKATFAVATDPFFGRGGRLLARNQRDAKMKYEAIVPIAGNLETAVTSFNYHGDHLGRTFGLMLADGGVAHTACVGFGLERITIALFAKYGCNVRDWPLNMRLTLNLEDI